MQIYLMSTLEVAMEVPSEQLERATHCGASLPPVKDFPGTNINIFSTF